MRRGVASGLLTLALALDWAAAPASAQQQPTAAQQQPTAAAPTTSQEDLAIIAPPSAREATRARESEFYPGEDIRVRHEPAFIRSLSAAPASGPIKRLGVSGWTAPPGRGDGILAHEVSGWFGFGFSFIWE
jgi:hypothetical protein